MKRNIGMFYLAAAFSLAGSAVVAAGYVTGSLKPFTLTFFSLVFGLSTASLLSGPSMLRTAKAMAAREWRILFLQAFFGIFLFRTFLAFGLTLTSAAEAGILIGSTPALTALLTRIFLKEPLSLRAVSGIALTLAGILVIQGFPFNMAAFTIQHLAGNLLVLGSAFCEAVFSMLARKIQTGRHGAEQLNPIAQSGLVSGMALLMCTLPMLWEGGFGASFSLGYDSWIALLWYGGMATVAAFAFMFMGARTCDGYTIAAFSGMMPLAALVLSVIFLKEQVSLQQLVGCACIIGAIVVMSGRSGKIRR